MVPAIRNETISKVYWKRGDSLGAGRKAASEADMIVANPPYKKEGDSIGIS